jgi:hypothetical protein
MKLSVAVLALLFYASVPVLAAERAPLDVRGTWVGVSISSVYGTGQHHPGGKDSEVRFRRIEMSYSIDKQEGRNFAAMKSSAARSEPVVGCFASDLKGGVMADLDGHHTFKLLGKDRMEICYTGNFGSDTVTKIASCYEVQRKDAKGK